MTEKTQFISVACDCPVCRQVESAQYKALESPDSHTTFFIVMRDKPGGTYVSKRHPHFINAEKEAIRLCRKEGGKESFYILEAIVKVEANEIPTTSTRLKPPVAPLSA